MAMARFNNWSMANVQTQFLMAKFGYEYETALYSNANAKMGEKILWSVSLEENDARCLRIQNELDVALPPPKKLGDTSTAVVDTDIKVAIPKGFAALIAQLNVYGNRKIDESIRVATGVIDSGYRGNIKVVVCYGANSYHRSKKIEAGGLVLRLALVKLHEIDTENRSVIELYNQQDELDKSFLRLHDFVSSVEYVSESNEPLYPLPPPRGAEYWPGTKCVAMARLYGPVADTATRFVADDCVDFIVRTQEALVVGFKRCPTMDDAISKPVRLFRSAEFATTHPFLASFGNKREEDAGYDIYYHGTKAMVLLPRVANEVVIRQRYLCDDKNVTPCIFGRSSMNARGLVVAPTIWHRGDKCRFCIFNMNDTAEIINPGERIGQLLILESDSPIWIPTETVNKTEPFITPELQRKSTRKPTDGATSRSHLCFHCSYPIWQKTSSFERDAKKSERNLGGFGSTGR
ncbi:deoxyuridine triphosphatase [Spheniscid alphaherpesvirus 1]|uniref:dUTP diphosphatase n=1 Tax=Spheniscid alphaherpesvirus 1 TaxID=2560777 RepID=A0A1R3TFK2_9ALPH|nr:deoxyuridine triphosphatase [Spheniscid alphaherpesvirus 1]SCO83498.1 deoxyuridine triphosphatase [Spheniscid alphaherpesvirus 1]